MFGHQTPDGYPLDGAGWASSGQISRRFEIARTIGAGSAGLFDPENGGTPRRSAAFRSSRRRVYFDVLRAAPVRARPAAALSGRGSQQEWNTFLLASPEFNYALSRLELPMNRRRAACAPALPLAPALTLAGRLFAAPAPRRASCWCSCAGATTAPTCWCPSRAASTTRARPKIAIAKPRSRRSPMARWRWIRTGRWRPAVRDSLGPAVSTRSGAVHPVRRHRGPVPQPLRDPGQHRARPARAVARAISAPGSWRGSRPRSTGAAPIAFTDTSAAVLRGEIRTSPNISLQRRRQAALRRRARPRSCAACMPATDSSRRSTEGLELRQEVAQAMQEEMQAANRGAITTKGFELTAERMARLMRDAVPARLRRCRRLGHPRQRGRRPGRSWRPI